MGPENTWGEWRRHLRSGPELQLGRVWYRRVECPVFKVDAGRACRTSNGHPTDRHRGRRDAAGPLPYEQWKQQELWAEPQRFTMPAVLKEVEKARTAYEADLAPDDGVAVVRIFFAERLGLSLEDEATLDRIDDAARRLLQVRGQERSADLVTVLASLIVALLSMMAGPDGDPEPCSTL
ncbi:zinc finger domain-containing protein [Streptomyces sp. 1222.5]|uniref:zinc finger domain-containing protein n=1 Tax=Streptomyces sp. 1222.5 TaxID=1881026 RepID=UPI003EB7C3C7